jgi:hypothetical protein
VKNAGHEPEPALLPLIKQRSSIMSAIITLLYREYCRRSWRKCTGTILAQPSDIPDKTA